MIVSGHIQKCGVCVCGGGGGGGGGCVSLVAWPQPSNNYNCRSIFIFTWLKSAVVISSSSRQGKRWTKDNIWYLALTKFALVSLLRENDIPKLTTMHMKNLTSRFLVGSFQKRSTHPKMKYGLTFLRTSQGN